MEEPDFWDDPERSQEMMKELKSLKDDKETYENLESQMEDMETLIEMGYEENDPHTKCTCVNKDNNCNVDNHIGYRI